MAEVQAMTLIGVNIGVNAGNDFLKILKIANPA